MKKLLVFLFLVSNALALHAAEYVEGKHYQKIGNAQIVNSGDKVLVQEFFWYGCPHCYSFEPFVKSWKKTKSANVEFARVPAIFRPEWEIQARTYYALESMGMIEEVHGKIFDAMHKQKKRLNTKKLITDFVVAQGVDEAKFNKEYNSFSVDTLARKAKKYQALYKIQGVPSVIVNGKYLTSGSMSGNYDNLIKIIDYLVKLELDKK